MCLSQHVCIDTFCNIRIIYSVINAISINHNQIVLNSKISYLLRRRNLLSFSVFKVIFIIILIEKIMGYWRHWVQASVALLLHSSSNYACFRGNSLRILYLMKLLKSFANMSPFVLLLVLTQRSTSWIPLSFQSTALRTGASCFPLFSSALRIWDAVYIC